MPFYVKLYILPNRVSIEIVNWLQILIKVYICSKGYVGIMCWLEVGHTAGRNAKAAQH